MILGPRPEGVTEQLVRDIYELPDTMQLSKKRMDWPELGSATFETEDLLLEFLNSPSYALPALWEMIRNSDDKMAHVTRRTDA